MFILIYKSSAPRVGQQACDSFSVNIYWVNKYIQSSNTLSYTAFEWKSNENISESTLKFKSVSSECKLFLFYHISEYYNPSHSWDLTAVWHGRAMVSTKLWKEERDPGKLPSLPRFISFYWTNTSWIVSRL